MPPPAFGLPGQSSQALALGSFLLLLHDGATSSGPSLTPLAKPSPPATDPGQACSGRGH